MSVTVELGSGVIRPGDDIDIYKEVDDLRVERMDEDKLWMAGYSDDGLEYRFWIGSTGDGLVVKYTINDEISLESIPTGEWCDKQKGGVSCTRCQWTGSAVREVVYHYSAMHEEAFSREVSKQLGFEPGSLDIHDSV